MKKNLTLFLFSVLSIFILTTPADAVAYSFTRPLDMTTKGEDVENLQSILKEDGYFTGTPTGLYGAATVKAVRLFQTKNGLAAVGVVGPKTLEKLNSRGVVLGSTTDTTPRIMYWYGKVNQHVDSQGVWQTDPDGSSGANLDKLTYCKKWYPNTTSVTPYLSETIDTWRAAGNTGAYTATFTSDKCVAAETVTTQKPVVRVISPNGGETYQPGQQITVKWETSGIPSGMNALIIINDEVNNIGGDLAVNTPNDGIEVVTLPTQSTWGSNLVFGGTFYKVRVSFAPFGEYSGVDTSDASDGLFTIKSLVVNGCDSNSTPSITVLSPNGGEIFIAGQQVTVKWTSCNTLNSKVRALLSYQNTSQGVSTTLTGSGNGWIDDDGQETITIPNLGDWGNLGVQTQAGKFYKIFMETYFDPPVIPTTYATDFSDNLFTINSPTSTTCLSTSTPSITVSSPNGGEVYKSGQGISVNWTNCNLPKDSVVTAQLENITAGTGISPLRPEGVLSGMFSNATDNDGHEIFYLPTESEAGVSQGLYGYGKNFKLALTVHHANNYWPTGNNPHDRSDNLFTINPVVTTVPLDPTPRIAYWWGKVNQHVDAQGNWLTDPDGTSGANLDKLTYCKKWYPKTTSVQSYKSETITTWKRAIGYEQSNYVNTVVTDKCVQGDVNSNYYVSLTSPKSGDTFSVGQYIDVRWTTNAPSNTYVYLLIMDTNSNVIKEVRTPNDGQEMIRIPQNTASGQYKVYYQVVLGPNASGYHMTDYAVFNVGSYTTNTQSTSDFTFTRSMRLGTRGGDVTALQKELSTLGVYSGPITGYFGPMTVAGVKKFQDIKGLPMVGIVGPKTLQVLNQ